MTKAQAGKFMKFILSVRFTMNCVNLCHRAVIVQVLEGENAISKNREVMGATNPADAAFRNYAG